MSIDNIIYKFNLIDEKIRFGKESTAENIRTALLNKGINCSLKTIYNDIDAIERIYKQPISRKSGRFTYENDEFSINKIKVNEEDESIFEMVLLNIQNLKPTGIYDKYSKILDKVLSDLTKGKKIKNLKSFNAIQPEISYGNKGYEWIEPIFNAIINKEAIELVYQKAKSAPEKKILSPYILKEFRNRWYCIGYDHLKTNLTKVYSLDRMHSVESSAKAYWEDSHFDTEAFFKFSFGIYHDYKLKPIKIKLEFYEQFIETIQNHPLMPTQKSKLIKRGKALEVELELYISYEIESEILKYGNLVKVISPLTLAEKIKNKAEKIIDNYKN